MRRDVAGIMNALISLNQIQEEFSKKTKAFLSLETLLSADKLMREMSALQSEEYNIFASRSGGSIKLNEDGTMQNGEEIRKMHEDLLNEEVELKVGEFNIIVTEPEIVPIALLATFREVFGEDNVKLESSRI